MSFENLNEIQVIEVCPRLPGPIGAGPMRRARAQAPTSWEKKTFQRQYPAKTFTFHIALTPNFLDVLLKQTRTGK